MLNEEQKKLVEENHKLIWFVINKYHLNADEYWDILAIALCKAAKRFNPSKNIKFSTFATHCITMAAFGELRKSLKKPKIVPYDEKKVKGSYEDCYVDLDCLNEIEKKVATLKVQGYNHVEISKIVNVNKNKVTKILNDIKCKIGGNT